MILGNSGGLEVLAPFVSNFFATSPFCILVAVAITEFYVFEAMGAFKEAFQL